MTKLLAVVAVLSAFAGFANDVAEIRAKVEQGHRVIAVDKFHGFDRVVFDFDGYEAWVVCPLGETREGTPWTWTMQWAKAFVPRTNVPQMLRDGYHHATIITFARRMDETGLKVSAAFQKYLVEKLGFAPKAYLIGMSWGGFFSVRYANAYPQKVAKIYLDAPLLSFHNFLASEGAEVVAKRIGPWAADCPSNGDWASDPRMPVNMAAAVAKAGVLVYLLYGGQDQTVNPKVNCELFAERFKAAGGMLKVDARSLYGHHPHGFEHGDIPRIVEFFEHGM